jgi:hypothetical protein
MSPSLPMIGVATEALSRYAVSTQPTALWEVCSELWISARAGTTSDCRSAYEMPPRARTARMIRGFGLAARRKIA